MRGIIAALFVWLMFLTFITGGQYVLINRGRANARADSRQLWRTVICTIESETLKNPKITQAQRTQAVRFWTELLVTKVHTTPCD